MRAKLTRLFTTLLIATALLSAILGHVDLWRVVLRCDGRFVWNLRLVIPLGLFGLSALGLFGCYGDAFTRFVRSRRAVTFLHAGLLVAVALVIAVFVNLISYRRYERFDLTARGTYTVSERTRNVLVELPRPVRAHVFLDRGGVWYPTVQGLLETYVAESRGRFSVEHLDPGRDQARLQEELLALGLEPTDLPDPRVIILESRAGPDDLPRTRVVTLPSLVEVVRGGGGAGAQEVRFRGEEELTRALLAVSQDRQPSVYFTTGHTELDLVGGRPDRSLKAFWRSLRALDYGVVQLRLDEGGGAPRIPEGCDALVIAGPGIPFGERVTAELTRWLGQGGRLLVLTEPRLSRALAPAGTGVEASGLEELLARFGVGAEAALVRDDQHSVRFFGEWSFEAPFAGPSEHHAITSPLARRRLWLRLQRAQPLTLHPSPGAGAGLEVLPILRAAPTARSVRAGQRPAEEQAPILAVAARRRLDGGREARVVVVGDATVASDLLAGPNRRTANLSFLTNAVGWLTEREATISVAAKAPSIICLQLDRDALRRLWLLCLLEVPAACVAVALGIMALRR